MALTGAILPFGTEALEKDAYGHVGRAALHEQISSRVEVDVGARLRGQPLHPGRTRRG